MPVGATTFGNSKLKEDEDRVRTTLEAFREGNLGQDVVSMVRGIVVPRHSKRRGKTRGSRRVITMTGAGVPKDTKHSYTAIQGSNDAFFDKVDQTVYAGPQNIASFLVGVASSGGIADELKAAIEQAIQEAEETAS